MPQPTPALNPFRVVQKHRNFRIFWGGHSVSLIGTWMQTVAQGWLALELTNDPFMVGLVSAAGSLPVLIFSLFAGVLADRYDKLRIVRTAQVLLLMQAATLWWFVWSGEITIGWLTTLAVLNGCIFAFEIPARQSYLIELVGREDLLDAIALNSGGFNLARIIGPGIAAVVIATVGLEWCFAVNAFSYLAALGGLFLMRVPPRQSHAGAPTPLEGLWQGITFMRSSREVSILMRMVAVYSVFGIPVLVLMPVIARDVLGSTATAYSILYACVGAGALTAALVLATIGRRVPRGKLLALSGYAFPVLLILFATARALPLAGALLVAVGFTMVLTNALANAILQTVVPDGLRGRVMAAYAWVFIGLGPIGSLLAGAAARYVGAPLAIAIGGGVTLAFASWVFTRHAELRAL
jgi:MFS family permease